MGVWQNFLRNVIKAAQQNQEPVTGIGPETLRQLQGTLTGGAAGAGGGGGGRGRGGGGGGGGGAPLGWAGPAANWLPWATWGQTPWAGLEGEKELASRAQAWMNVGLPWYQAAQQAAQWGQEFDWRKVMDRALQEFEREQFGWQKEQDVWGQGFQEKALEQEQENVAMQTFGRRFRPNTRWF